MNITLVSVNPAVSCRLLFSSWAVRLSCDYGSVDCWLVAEDRSLSPLLQCCLTVDLRSSSQRALNIKVTLNNV